MMCTVVQFHGWPALLWTFGAPFCKLLRGKRLKASTLLALIIDLLKVKPTYRGRKQTKRYWNSYIHVARLHVILVLNRSVRVYRGSRQGYCKRSEKEETVVTLHVSRFFPQHLKNFNGSMVASHHRLTSNKS